MTSHILAPVLSSPPHPDSTLYPFPAQLAYTPPIFTAQRLPNISTNSLALHHALYNFRNLDDHYALEPYDLSFNWDKINLPQDIEQTWYCVAFRSRRKADSVDKPLYEADEAAHSEAIASGGLILYWYGITHLETSRNLATCIWESREHAQIAGKKPGHVRAMSLLMPSYDEATIESWKLIKEKGTTSLRLEQMQKTILLPRPLPPNCVALRTQQPSVVSPPVQDSSSSGLSPLNILRMAMNVVSSVPSSFQ